MSTRTLSVVITANTTSLRAGLGVAAAEVRGFGNDVRRVANDAKVNTDIIGRGFLAAGGLIVAGFAASVVAAAQFERSMRNVTTISSYVDKNFEQVSARLLQMSNTLPQSANELAEGLYQVASSGFAGAEGVGVLEQSAKAASAGLATTSDAATAITGVLNAYGLGADQARKISDQMFQTVNLGVVSFSELSHEIGGVVGTAAAAGVPFRDVGAALATITLAGIPAAEATTALNRVLQAILVPSEAMSDVLIDMGYATGQQALESDGLHKVMTKLVGSTGGNVEKLHELFPEVRGLKGALALTAAEGENWNRVLKGMDDSTKGAGATQRALEQQQKSLSYQFEVTKNQIVNFGIEIGTTLLPPLKFITGVLSDAVDMFRSLPGPVRDGISALLGLAAVVLISAGAYLLISQRIAKAKLALDAMGESGTKLQQMGARTVDLAGSLTRLVAGAGIAAASFTQLGHGAQETGMGIAGMAAGGALAGSVFGPLGGLVGGLAGTFVGLGKTIVDGTEDLDTYRGKFEELADTIASLDKKAALDKFLNSLGMSDLVRAFAGDVKGVADELEALGRKSPASAAKVVRALKEMRDEGGKKIFTKSDAEELDRILERIADKFHKGAEAKKRSSEADQAVAEGTRKARQEISQLGTEEDNAATSGAKLTESQKDLADVLSKASGPLDAYQVAVKRVSDFTGQNLDAAGDAWWRYADTARLALGDFLNELEAKLAGLQNWQQNLITIAQRGGIEFARQLAALGPTAAGLVADISTASQPEFDRAKTLFGQQAFLTGDSAAKNLDLGMKLAQMAAANGGAIAAQTLVDSFGSKAAEVAFIAQAYGITIVGSVNSIISAFGGANPQAAVSGSSSWFGGIRHAEGGFETHTAQIAPGGNVRVWAEPETGGEAYIPLSRNKRARSTMILGRVASHFGMRLSHFADGGFFSSLFNLPRPEGRFPAGLLGESGLAGGRKMYAAAVAKVLDEYRKYEERQAVATFLRAMAQPSGVAGAGMRGVAGSVFDRGGILRPGFTLAWNGTGRDERVVPPGSGQRPIVVNSELHIHGPFYGDDKLKEELRKSHEQHDRDLARAVRKGTGAGV